MKRCSKCGLEKPLDEFYLRSTARDGRMSHCKQCNYAMSLRPPYDLAGRRVLRAEYRKREPDKVRASKARHTRHQALQNFGLTEAEYERMLARQNGVCFICKKSSNFGKRLCIDHDHATGKLRGLLCFRCNRMIGMAHDDVTVLSRAISYLKAHRVLKRQSGVCAICGDPPAGNGKGQGLCIDHDHETGKLRGLLCFRCNRMLGMAHDDVTVLSRAVAYLQQHR